MGIARLVVLVALATFVSVAITGLAIAFGAAHGWIPDVRNATVAFVAVTILYLIPGLAIGYGVLPLSSLTLDMPIPKSARWIFWAVSLPVAATAALIGAA